MNISIILRQLREEKGLYQKELAVYLNVSVGTISNYENGVHQPDLDTLIRLSEFYGVTSDYLLGLTAYPYRPDTLSKFITKSYSMPRFFSLLQHLSGSEKNLLAHILCLFEKGKDISPDITAEKHSPNRTQK